MSRYIDAEELKQLIQNARRSLDSESKDFHTRDEMLLNFEQYVNLAPTADVADWDMFNMQLQLYFWRLDFLNGNNPF